MTASTTPRLTTASSPTRARSTRSAEPDEIVARDAQERELATLLNGVHEGDLPTTVSIYGPLGTGKTLTTRRVCLDFVMGMDRVTDVAVNE